MQNYVEYFYKSTGALDLKLTIRVDDGVVSIFSFETNSIFTRKNAEIKGGQEGDSQETIGQTVKDLLTKFVHKCDK